MKGGQYTVELSRSKVTAHSVLDLQLLRLLIEFAAENVEVDRVDNQVLKGTDRRCLERAHQVGVWENLGGCVLLVSRDGEEDR